MNKVMSIDFIRQVLEQTLYIEHIKNNYFYGGRNQVSILSFYEQLLKQEDLDRYVEIFRDLTNQQNRTGLIANGVIAAPENPQIVNINSSMIIPMTWTLAMRCTLENRDELIATLDNLSKQLRGRKQDVAELNTGELFMVGTPFQNDGKPTFKQGDYVGNIGLGTLSAFMSSLYSLYVSTNYANWFTSGDYFYYEESGLLKVGRATYSSGVWSYEQITSASENIDSVIFPPEHTSFTKYKLSVSFDTTRVDEPRTLNAKDFCTVSIGGSATLVNNGVVLGNDICKVSVQKYFIKSNPDIIFQSATITYLEPLELSSGTGMSNQLTQTMSSFIQNKHNDGINPTINYSFILDTKVALLKQLYRYARYGVVSPSVDGISPNMIYKFAEYKASWGEYDVELFNGKLTENIDIENTESDAMTIAIQVEIQEETPIVEE